GGPPPRVAGAPGRGRRRGGGEGGVHTRRGRVPRRGLASGQVLATREPDRQRLRRSQRHVRVPAGRRLRGGVTRQATAVASTSIMSSGNARRATPRSVPGGATPAAPVRSASTPALASK